MAGRRTLTALGIAATLVVAACGDDGGSAEGASGDAAVAADPGDDLGSVTVEPLGDTDGDPVSLGSLVEGRPAVVNFFASWCPPCIEEMPGFEAVHQDLGDRVSFVGLATSDDEDRALDLVDRTGITFPTYADPTGEALVFFEATGMPTTVFVSAGGQVLDVHSGELDEDELRGRISDLLGVT